MPGSVYLKAEKLFHKHVFYVSGVQATMLNALKNYTTMQVNSTKERI